MLVSVMNTEVYFEFLILVHARLTLLRLWVSSIAQVLALQTKVLIKGAIPFLPLLGF